MRKLKSRKPEGKGEVTGKMIKGGRDMGVEWIWKLCNMALESCEVSEDWISVVVVSLYKGKG